MTKILFCPFCASDRIIIADYIDEWDQKSNHIQCKRCKGTFKVEEINYD